MFTHTVEVEDHMRFLLLTCRRSVISQKGAENSRRKKSRRKVARAASVHSAIVALD